MKIDTINKMILYLHLDARKTYKDIAAKLNRSETTVTFFVDRGGIQSFTMYEGVSENIDANGDGKDDFKVTCKAITSDPAEGCS